MKKITILIIILSTLFSCKKEDIQPVVTSYNINNSIQYTSLKVEIVGQYDYYSTFTYTTVSGEERQEYGVLSADSIDYDLPVGVYVSGGSIMYDGLGGTTFFPGEATYTLYKNENVIDITTTYNYIFQN